MEVLIRFFNLHIVFFVLVCNLLVRFCVFVYFLVDVDLCCLNYLVMGLDLALVVVVLLVVKREKGGFMVKAKTMLLCLLTFIDRYLLL